jgi:hypothetical protein
LGTYGITHITTSAFHPQANGLAERSVQLLINGLRRRAAIDPTSWDNEVAPVLFGYRIIVQSSVGFTPFYSLYGREPALSMGTQSQIILPVSTDHEDWDLEEATTHLLQRIDDLANAHGKALVNLEKAQEKQKRDFDNRHRTFEKDKTDDQKIEIGDYVIARTAKRSKVHSNAIGRSHGQVGPKTANGYFAYFWLFLNRILGLEVLKH